MPLPETLFTFDYFRDEFKRFWDMCGDATWMLKDSSAHLTDWRSLRTIQPKSMNESLIY